MLHVIYVSQNERETGRKRERERAKRKLEMIPKFLLHYHRHRLFVSCQQLADLSDIVALIVRFIVAGGCRSRFSSSTKADNASQSKVC